MKWIIVTLLLSGCAGYEPAMTVDQRIAYMRMIHDTHYVQPMPQPMYVPQQRQPFVCTPGYNNTVVCQ